MNSRIRNIGLWLVFCIVFCCHLSEGNTAFSSGKDIQNTSSEIPEVNILNTRSEWISFLSNYATDDIDNDYLDRHAKWIEENYLNHHQINGVSYMTTVDSNTNKSANHFSVDAAIYSGYYAAAAVLRSQEQPTSNNMTALFNSLRGIYILTHASGIAGLTSKAIIPMDRLITEFGLPNYWLPHLKEKQKMFLKRKQKLKFNIEWNKKNRVRDHLPTTHLELMKTKGFSDPLPPTLSSPEAPGERRWRERIITAGQSYIGPSNLMDPLYFMGISQTQLKLPQILSYQRTTKDQLTGILLALAVAIKYLKPSNYPTQYKDRIINSRELAKLIAWNVYHRLRRHNYVLKDQNGITKTSSRNVSGLLRINLILLAKTVADENRFKVHKIFPQTDWREQARNLSTQLEKEFGSTFDIYLLGCRGISSLENSVLRYKNYYKWNLRFTRIYAALLLENNPHRAKCYDKYMKKALWPYVKKHKNSMFNFIYSLKNKSVNNATKPATESLNEGLRTLRSLAIRPLKDWSSPDHHLHSESGNSLWDDFTNHIPRILPPHKRAFWGMFIWASEPFYYAYDYQRGPAKELASSEAPGVDYLFAYWLGRFYYPQYFLTSNSNTSFVKSVKQGILRRL